MRRFPVFVLALGLISNLVSQLHAQDDSYETKVGLSASLQASQFDVMLPIWGSDHFSIAPAFGIVWGEDVGSDIHFGLVPRFFFHKNKVAPYIGGRIGLLIASPKNGESATDVITGLMFGGEYFLDDHFSSGLESQLNLTISDKQSTRFGNPGKTNINTAAAAFATIYF